MFIRVVDHVWDSVWQSYDGSPGWNFHCLKLEDTSLVSVSYNPISTTNTLSTIGVEKNLISERTSCAHTNIAGSPCNLVLGYMFTRISPTRSLAESSTR